MVPTYAQENSTAVVTGSTPDARRNILKEEYVMNFFRTCTLFVLLAGVVLAGCCGPGGGGATVENKSITTTKSLGEQLMDLQKAYESGAITESQYNDLKKKTIEQSPEVK
jgi:hypothetical protein